MTRELPIITSPLPDLSNTSLHEAIGETRWPLADCRRCIGACCLAGMQLPLTGAEAEALTKRGASLKEYGPAPALIRKHIFRKREETPRTTYTLLEDCPNLDNDGTCSVYGSPSPDRPQVCADLRTGTHTCISAQLKAIEAGRAQHRPDNSTTK